MLFTSYIFAVFLVVVLSAYWLLRGKLFLQNVLLLAASYFFYGYWDVRFLYLIVISTCVDYCCAQLIDRGGIAFIDRIKVSAVVVLAALAFVVPNYEFFEISLAGLSLSSQIDWQQLLENPFGWKVFGIAFAIVVVLNLAYPLTQRLDQSQKRKGFVIVSIQSWHFLNTLTFLQIVSVRSLWIFLASPLSGIRLVLSCPSGFPFIPSRPSVIRLMCIEGSYVQLPILRSLRRLYRFSLNSLPAQLSAEKICCLSSRKADFSRIGKRLQNVFG